MPFAPLIIGVVVWDRADEDVPRPIMARRIKPNPQGLTLLLLLPAIPTPTTTPIKTTPIPAAIQALLSKGLFSVCAVNGSFWRKQVKPLREVKVATEFGATEVKHPAPKFTCAAPPSPANIRAPGETPAPLVARKTLPP